VRQRVVRLAEQGGAVQRLEVGTHLDAVEGKEGTSSSHHRAGSLIAMVILGTH
jgi:hypothetical protein